MIDKWDFYGKDVPEAILAACDELDVAQEQLNISIIEAGSVGIFGFARKQAHIEVSHKQDSVDGLDRSFAVDEIFEDITRNKTDTLEKPKDIAPEILRIIRKEVECLAELIGYPSTCSITVENGIVKVSLHGENSEGLIGEEGRVLDAFQYIIRKIIGRQADERISIMLDVGEYRRRRLQELKDRVGHLAAMVRKNGKPQIISALSPAERRELHVMVRREKGVRSRSVGDGIFRKILIYKVKKQKSEKLIASKRHK